MALLNSFPTNYSWSNKLLDTSYSGPCVRVRKSQGDPATDPVQDFNYVSGEIDQAALSSWLGVDTGYVVTAYNPNGTNWTQSDPAKQPPINEQQDENGLAMIMVGGGFLEIADGSTFADYSFYFSGQIFGSETSSNFPGGSYMVSTTSTSGRGDIYIRSTQSTGSGDYDTHNVQILGNTQSTALYETNAHGADETQNKIYSAKVSNTNNLASLYYNRSPIFENEAFQGSTGSGVTMGRSGFPPIHVSSFLYYPNEQHSDSTRFQIESVLAGSEIWLPYKVNGDPLPGIKVLYLTADDRNFTNASILQIATSDNNGNAPLTEIVPSGNHLFVVTAYEVPDPAPNGLTIGDVYSEIGRWIDGFPT